MMTSCACSPRTGSIVYLWNYNDLSAVVRSIAAVLRRINLQVWAGLLFTRVTFCPGQFTVAWSACSRLTWRHAKLLKNIDWCFSDLSFDNSGTYTCKQLVLHIIAHITCKKRQKKKYSLIHRKTGLKKLSVFLRNMYYYILERAHANVVWKCDECLKNIIYLLPITLMSIYCENRIT